jgi:hypothetical protein
MIEAAVLGLTLSAPSERPQSGHRAEVVFFTELRDQSALGTQTYRRRLGNSLALTVSRDGGHIRSGFLQPLPPVDRWCQEV